jgi:integrase
MTGGARTWVLDPGVRRALTAWVKLRGLEKGALLFTDEFGRPHENDRLAERLRAHLLAAGVDRTELHTSGVNRRQLRAHDLRGTFVTLSLANGEKETFVPIGPATNRSIMINRYRRAARTASELELGRLAPLDLAVPELRPEASEQLAKVTGGQQAVSAKNRKNPPGKFRPRIKQQSC